LYEKFVSKNVDEIDTWRTRFFDEIIIIVGQVFVSLSRFHLWIYRRFKHGFCHQVKVWKQKKRKHVKTRRGAVFVYQLWNKKLFNQQSQTRGPHVARQRYLCGPRPLAD